jgi:hypothetical protein
MRLVEVSPVAPLGAPPSGSNGGDAGGGSDTSEAEASSGLSLSVEDVERSMRTLSATEHEIHEDGFAVVGANIVWLVERAQGGLMGRKRPLVVFGVAPTHFSWKLGFRNGDKLVSLDGNDLAVAASTARDRAHELLEGAEPRKRLTIGIVRNGTPTDLVYRFTKCSVCGRP